MGCLEASAVSICVCWPSFVTLHNSSSGPGLICDTMDHAINLHRHQGGRFRLLTKSVNSSGVMFGLVPNIHNILKNMDPRHKAEGDY